MANQENLEQYKWKAGQSGNPKGRPRKIYSVLKESGYAGDDIKTAFAEMAFYQLEELKALYSDESKPVIVRIVANQLFKALTGADWNKIKEIIEHVIGKPTQQMEHSGEVTVKGFWELYEEAQTLKEDSDD